MPLLGLPASSGRQLVTNLQPQLGNSAPSQPGPLPHPIELQDAAANGRIDGPKSTLSANLTLQLHEFGARMDLGDAQIGAQAI